MAATIGCVPEDRGAWVLGTADGRLLLFPCQCSRSSEVAGRVCRGGWIHAAVMLWLVSLVLAAAWPVPIAADQWSLGTHRRERACPRSWGFE